MEQERKTEEKEALYVALVKKYRVLSGNFQLKEKMTIDNTSTKVSEYNTFLKLSETFRALSGTFLEVRTAPSERLVACGSDGGSCRSVLEGELTVVNFYEGPPRRSLLWQAGSPCPALPGPPPLRWLLPERQRSALAQQEAFERN